MSRPTVQVEGLVIGRMTVIRQVGTYQGGQTKYAVHWSCCGAEERLSRTSILGRLSRKQSCAMCRRCLARASLARRMPAWHPWTAGESVAGVRIDAVLAVGETMPLTFYRCTYDCCGRVAELSHHQLQQRKRMGRAVCNTCQRARNNEARREATDRAAVLARGTGSVPTLAVPVLRCNGHDWPTLGPMGRR